MASPVDSNNAGEPADQKRRTVSSTCFVYGCCNQGGSTNTALGESRIRFFQIPTTPQSRRRAFILFARRGDVSEPKTQPFCHIHFAEEDIVKYSVRRGKCQIQYG